MKKETVILYSDREFINPPEYGGHAALSVHISEHRNYAETEEEEKESNEYSYITTKLAISDCYRTIELDIDLDNNPETVEKTKLKIGRMYRFFKELNDFMQNYEHSEFFLKTKE